MPKQLRKGDVVRDYRLITDFTTANAGTSFWALCERAGKQYFLKNYLAPVYPTESALGSPANKAKQLREAQNFEKKVKQTEEAIRRCGPAPYLVQMTDFFRNEHGQYFKVTPMISSVPLDTRTLSTSNRFSILLTLSGSLLRFHEAGLVHADMKWENVLFSQRHGLLVPYVIDFDSCFFPSAPPPPSELISDQAYWAPEMIGYMAGEKGVSLDHKIDIFACGLIFCILLAGRLPQFSSTYACAGDALRSGGKLDYGKPLLPLLDLVRSMTDPIPASRPNMGEIWDDLQQWGRKNGHEISLDVPIAPSAKPIKPATPIIIPESEEATVRFNGFKPKPFELSADLAVIKKIIKPEPAVSKLRIRGLKMGP